MFKKILVANRGEIAVRIIRACREMGISTVAVFSQADAESLHVRYADEAVCVGPPPTRESYANVANIIMAATITGAEAIHPGYGFLAEDSHFGEACEAVGLKFIGPRPGVIERLGDKASARELARSANVPIIPGTPGVLQSDNEALKSAAAIGYPLMVKATAGGGGKGIRIVHNDTDLISSLRMAQQEAAAAFGVPDVYLEKYLEEPRHIEVQILADEHGQIVHLGERDCSLQTARHQKMLEEAPSAIPAGVRNKLGEAAIRAAKAAGYTNAGTFEFLVDRENNFYFLEANTRLQVEHPITEAITGLDIVKLQIRIADGQKLGLSQRDIKFEGHAIECRITAEDPERNFTPSAGPIKTLVLPGGPGVRVDSHIYAGYTVPSYYDSLLAKVIVWGADRREAIARMARCLDEMQIEGIRTTLPFYMRVMNNAWFRRGEVYTNFVRRRMEA